MKQIVTLLSILLAVGLLSATVTLRHDPPMTLQTDREMQLELEVLQGFDEIDQVDLYYREGGSATYVNIMQETQTEPSYVFNVPPLKHPEKGLEYYFVVTQTNGTIQSLPSVQPELNPYRVQFDKVETPSDAFVRLSPDSGGLPAGEPLVIAISTFAVAGQIDPASIAITYDGKDMTDMAQISGNMVVLNIARPKTGTHSYQVSAKLNNGRHIVSRRWQTDTGAGAAFAMPLNITGSIDMNSLVRSYSADDDSRVSSDDDFKYADWNIRMNGNKDWFGFFTKLYLTSRETSQAQSVNRYALGFTTPFVNVTLGDETPNYDSFTMSNKNIRGIHTLYHTPDFRFYFNWGENRQAVEGGTTSFKRNTMGFRSEVGEQDAFQWGISVVKNKDDMDSIGEEYYISIDTTDPANPDTTVVLAPKDNLVLGTDVLFPFIKRKLEFGFEIAASLYNSNIYDGVISEEELEDYGIDDMPFDPESFENIIVINKNMEPFIPNMANVAYRTFLNVNMAGNFFTASYAAVGASYNSLSANYLQKDARILSLSDNVMLFRNQLLLSLGMNMVSDNLSKQKEATNTNTSFYVQAVARPNGMPVFKLGFSQTAAADDGDALENDQTGYIYGLEQTSQSISAGVSYNVEAIELAPTTFEVNWQQTSSTDDLNESYDNSINTIGLGASTRWRDLPLDTILRFSTSSSDNKTIENSDYNNPEYNETTDSYNSILLRGNLRFFENKLKPYASFQLTSFGGDGDARSISLFGVGTSYSFMKNFEASTGLNMKNYANSDTDNTDYSKMDWRFRVRYSF